MDHGEKMASDRSKPQKLIHESIEPFENSRMQYSAYKLGTSGGVTVSKLD